MRIFFTALPTILLLAPVPAGAQSAAGLMPHRAVYDLTLDKATDDSGISDISGRMVYEFRGSACDGYSVTFRFVTEIDTADATRLTDQQTTTFEDGDGKNFNFSTKSYVDRSLDHELRGAATLQDDGVKVTLQKPEESDISLPATQFPTHHMLELLKHAENGERFYETTLFDASDQADKLMTTSVVIGQPTSTKDTDPEAKALKDLRGDKYWPVEIAYFDLVGSGEELPDYRTSFKLYSNGLTRDLTMDYGDFSMKGKLVDLDMIDQKPDDCEKTTPR